MKKKIDIKIIDYDYFGWGISKESTKVCFVPKAKVGFKGTCYVVKEKNSYLEGVLSEEDFPKTNCPFYDLCGGCHVRHLSEQEELDFKVKKVRDLFKKNAHISLSNLSITKTKDDYYRNKVVFHLKDGEVGYYKEGSHELLPIDNCLLLEEGFLPVLEELKAFSKKIKREMNAMIRILNGKVLLALESDKTIPFTFNFNSVDTCFYQNKCLKGTPYLETSILDVKFRVSKDAFFQVNKQGMEVLYQKIKTYLKEVGAQKVLDLYCGVGSISLVISDVVSSILGVEVIKEAVLDANQNKKINKISNVSFLNGKVEDLLLKLPTDYDTVIVDPPRRGLDSKTKAFLLENNFETIIYVSCDPATLARDYLELSKIYTLKKIELVDMFPKTYHVECICVLTRSNS